MAQQKPRILCLHGSKSNNEITQFQLLGLGMHKLARTDLLHGAWTLTEGKEHMCLFHHICTSFVVLQPLVVSATNPQRTEDLTFSLRIFSRPASVISSSRTGSVFVWSLVHVGRQGRYSEREFGSSCWLLALTRTLRRCLRFFDGHSDGHFVFATTNMEGSVRFWSVSLEICYSGVWRRHFMCTKLRKRFKHQQHPFTIPPYPRKDW